MLTKCVNCGFYVQQNDEFCLNCGFEKPTVPINSEPNVNRILLFAILFIPLIFFVADSITSTGNRQSSLFTNFIIAVLIGFFTAFVSDYFYGEWNLNKQQENRINKNISSLQHKEEIIKRRISELNFRGQKIDLVLDKIKQNDTLQLQDVRRKLLSARQIVIRQIARYELQENKIKLARLQNGVSPYVNNLHRLNEAETENGLSAIEYGKYETEKMRQSLTNDYATEFPKDFEFEKQNFLKQAEETEDSCGKLREALLSRQATRALEGISTMNLPRSEEIAHAVETFNIQTTLTDFSESFDELEREYKRLRSENEISRDLLNE